MLDAWDQVAKSLPKTEDDYSDSISPPLLFREQQDILRIAVGDTASRRFAGTEMEPGVLEVDSRAVQTALRYLPMIVESSVAMHTLAYRIHAPSSKPRARPMALWDEYEIVYRSGPPGISEETYYGYCREFDLEADRATKRLNKLLEAGLLDRKADGNIFASVFKRI